MRVNNKSKTTTGFSHLRNKSQCFLNVDPNTVVRESLAALVELVEKVNHNFWG